MTEIKHRVVLSEQRMVKAKDDLKEMISTVLKQGLEGLVLKDINVSERESCFFNMIYEYLFIQSMIGINFLVITRCMMHIHSCTATYYNYLLLGVIPSNVSVFIRSKCKPVPITLFFSLLTALCIHFFIVLILFTFLYSHTF